MQLAIDHRLDGWIALNPAPAAPSIMMTPLNYCCHCLLNHYQVRMSVLSAELRFTAMQVKKKGDRIDCRRTAEPVAAADWAKSYLHVTPEGSALHATLQEITWVASKYHTRQIIYMQHNVYRISNRC